MACGILDNQWDTEIRKQHKNHFCYNCRWGNVSPKEPLFNLICGCCMLRKPENGPRKCCWKPKKESCHDQ